MTVEIRLADLLDLAEVPKPREKVDIADLVASPNFAPKAWQSPLEDDGWSYKPPVQDSPDLRRILALPRRPAPDEARAEALIELMTRRYALPEARACVCKSLGRTCITRLRIAQAWALFEIGLHGGLLGFIQVGAGKSALDLLAPLAFKGCRRALLLVPPSLVPQLVLDYRALAGHFRVPTFVVHTKTAERFIVEGAPELHVLPYSRLSRQECKVFIRDLAPDVIIADECFPAHTWVTTDVGQVPIADVVNRGVGTYALSCGANGLVWRRIVRRLKRPGRKPMVRVRHERGFFSCTADHKIWTTEGYVRAADLTPGAPLCVADYESVSSLRRAVPGHTSGHPGSEVLFGAVRQHGGEPTQEAAQVPPSHQPEGGAHVLEVRDAVSHQVEGRGDRAVLLGQLRHQPHVEGSNATEHVGCQEAQAERLRVQPGGSRGSRRKAEGSDVRGARRQRQADGAAASAVRANAVADGVADPDTSRTRAFYQSAGLLQGRSGGAVGAAGDRSGRQEPPVEEVEVPRSTQDRDPRVSRVVRVEVLERGSSLGPGLGRVGDPVYDLEVEGEHNYFADGVLVSNCHKLRNADTSGTSRVLKYFKDHQSTRFAGWSGSLTDASIMDYSHLLILAHRERSPLPLDPIVVGEWATAIDPGDNPAPMGALEALCAPGEHVQSGYRRRLLDTPGVTSSIGTTVDAELVVRERPAPPIPPVIREALNKLRDTWVRPDGEELLDALEVARVAIELAQGFYYYWEFVNGETDEQIMAWLTARKDWRSEAREKLKPRADHLDSELLVTNAAMRAWGDVEIKDKTLPVWKATCWPAWRDIANTVKPITRTCRLDDYLARDAAAWALENRGIVWYGARAFGLWVSELSGLPMHGGGPQADQRIKAERGDRSIVASIKSHGTGRDGLQHLFATQLFASPAPSAVEWEQALGRLHRSGQRSPVVSAWYYAHTQELRARVEEAMSRTAYVQGTTPYGAQKLLLGSGIERPRQAL